MKESREKEVGHVGFHRMDHACFRLAQACPHMCVCGGNQIELGEVRYPIFVALMEYLYTDEVRDRLLPVVYIAGLLGTTMPDECYVRSIS